MLFLLADFFNSLVERVMKLMGIEKPTTKPCGDRNLDGNLDNFIEIPTKKEVEAKLKEYSKVLPIPPGQPCTCVCEISPNEIISKSNVSIEACIALDRRYGHLFKITNLPPQNGA